ncbi:hypothetical protein ABFA07_011246 [Porites harrisoni]
MKVSRYTMAVEEKGTRFLEKIDFDEGNNVAVFRVPAHNNVNGADFYHDFNLRITIRRIPRKQVCYISEMSPSLKSIRKLKKDLKRVVSLSPPKELPVETRSDMVMVTGLVNRGLLSHEILDFCGVLPIYYTKRYTLEPTHDSNNGTATIRMRYQRRDERETTIVVTKKTLKLCPPEEDQLNYVQDCMMSKHWDLRCKMEPSSQDCYYFVTCEKKPNHIAKEHDWKCTKVHKSSDNPICCDFICHPEDT